MYKKIRKFLFKLDPEKAHNLSLSCLKIVGKIPFILKKISKPIEDPALERELFGLKFKNPVGLAAGLDKNAKYYKELSMLGFGFIEIGTVTPRPQPPTPGFIKNDSSDWWKIVPSSIEWALIMREWMLY